MIYKVANAKNKLSIVATPIGNMEEISIRALNALKTADIIFCEDTKSTLKLLNLLQIKNKILLRNDAHNENATALNILSKINDSKKVCLVSDAGYPLISDPGHTIVKLLYENQIAIEVINGPSALIHALVASGQNTKRFTFIGFLPSKKSERRNELLKLECFQTTLIFYEAPHRILESLKDIQDILGDRQVSICREMTKLNETIYKGLISEVISEINPIGEFVIILSSKSIVEKMYTIDEAVQIAVNFINNGEKRKEACKKSSKITNIKATDIYNNFNK